jgi:phosphatidylserine decarboxylase
MKHSGKARHAALKLVFWTLAGLLAIFVACIIAAILAQIVWALSLALVGLWAIFAAFTFYFFRDPEARVPSGAGLVLSPAHGKVDAIEQFTEPKFMGGPCQRISIFLSVIDVHVQNAPVTGKIVLQKYSPGQFLSALKAESAEHNENVLLGIQSAERPGTKIGVRLIAGVLARRIVPFVSEGEEIIRGERISLIQFGSRADVYLPADAKVKIKLGDRVVGGETVLAAFD